MALPSPRLPFLLFLKLHPMQHILLPLLLSVLAAVPATSAPLAEGEVLTLPSSVSFFRPFDVNPIGDGISLFVADTSNNCIRKINFTNIVTTFGLPPPQGSSGYADGVGTSAAFDNPTGVTVRGSNLYVVDTNNHRIRVISIETRVVSTLAGETVGFADGMG